MAEQATLTPVENKKKRTRRNYVDELQRIEAHCTACIDILESQPTTEFGKGQISAYQNILSKIGGKRGGK